MEHVDGSPQRRHVEHAVFATSSHANLPHAEPYGRQGFPVAGIEPVLNTAQFETGNGASIGRKVPECFP